MFSADRMSGYNFFESDLTTMLPREENADLIPLARKFNTATSYVQSIGLGDWGWFDQKGRSYENSRKYPFKIRFHPTGNIKTTANTTNG